MKTRIGLPTLIATLICLFYVVGVLRQTDGDPLSFVIYDGHYSYQIAYRLFNEESEISPAYPHADELPTAYRFQRILYPFLARLLALGWSELVPWTLIGLNLIAIAIGTWVTELLLRHHQTSNWYALIYGLYAGNLVALRSDMNEPLAMMLVMLAMLAWAKERHNWAFFWFALSLLAKETSLLFILAFGLYSVQQHNWRNTAGLGISLLPYMVWQFFLFSWLGEFGFSSGQAFIWLPFGGWLMSYELSWQALLLTSLLIIPIGVIPTIAGLIISIRSIARRFFHPYVYAILFNAIFMLFLPHLTFRESSAVIRVIQGLAITLLLLGALTQSKRILNYSVLWLFANVIVISGTG